MSRKEPTSVRRQYGATKGVEHCLALIAQQVLIVAVSDPQTNKQKTKPDIVTHPSNPSTQEAEASGSL